MVSLHQFEVHDSVTPTNRTLLQNLAAINDPVGLVSQVFVPAKVLFQELYVEKIGWDEPRRTEKILRWKNGNWILKMQIELHSLGATMMK